MKNLAMAIGFILINTSQYGTFTIGYYSSEARCHHVRNMLEGKKRAWTTDVYQCIPDDHELNRD